MKQETLSILFFILKTRLLKNGEAPVILRVTIEGRGSDEVRIQRSINPNLRDQAKGRSEGKDRASPELNNYIRDLGVKLSSIWMKVDPFLGRKFRQEETNPVFLTMEELDRLIKREFDYSTSFIAFLKETCITSKGTDPDCSV